MWFGRYAREQTDRQTHTVTGTQMGSLQYFATTAAVKVISIKVVNGQPVTDRGPPRNDHSMRVQHVCVSFDKYVQLSSRVIQESPLPLTHLAPHGG